MMIELRVVLHDRAQRSHGRRAQVELRPRDLAGEPGEVPAPEEHTRGSCRQARGDRAPEGLPCGPLVAGPVQRVPTGTGEPCPTERDGIAPDLSHEPVVRRGIQDRVAVVRLGAAGAVRVAELVAPCVLAAVGLEPVDPHLLDQVAALRHPPRLGLGIGPVGKQRLREPPAAVPVRTSVAVTDRVPAANHRVPVRLRLPDGRRTRLEERHLPQEDTDAAFVQPLDEAPGIRPGAVRRELELRQHVRRAVSVHHVPGVAERHERRLVAPGLDHDDPGGDPLGDGALHLATHPGIGVPLVRAHPGAEHPARRPDGPANLGKERREDLARRTGVQRDLDEGACLVRIERNLHDEAVPAARADVVPGPASRPNVEAPAPDARIRDHDRERHREVGSLPLAPILLEHDGVKPLAALVEAVEPLAEPEDVCVRLQGDREAHPERAVVGAQPLHAPRHESAGGPRAIEPERPAARSPSSHGQLVPAGPSPSLVDEAVAEPGAGAVRVEGDPPRPSAGRERRDRRRGEVAVGRCRGEVVVGRCRLPVRIGRVHLELETPHDPVDLDLEVHRGRALVGRRAQLDRRARDRPRRNALVELDPVGMAEPERPVADHVGCPPRRGSCRVMTAVARPGSPSDVPSTTGTSIAPSRIARTRYIAWDHRSGVAIGPHRATHWS